MVKPTGDEIVAKAREYIGTRWTHKGRVKGVGVDCVGLLVGVFSELGIGVVDELEYSSGDEFVRLSAHLKKYGWVIPQYELMNPGDVALFRNTKHAATQPMLNHVGIITGEGFIHAWSTPSAMRVVETPFDDFWRGCIARVYRLA
jgi:cell wall-associated NlpC family hydrolase